MRCENKVRTWKTLWLRNHICGKLMITQIRPRSRTYVFFCIHCWHIVSKTFEEVAKENANASIQR